MTARLPAPVPPMTEETRDFWEATAAGRLMLPRCEQCGLAFWYPRSHCPDCWSSELSWSEASGHGSVYSFSVIRRGAGAYREVTPYVLAYVELDEGPRMMTNLVDCDIDSLRIGQRVAVRFDATGEGQSLPRFVPVAD